MSIKRDIRTTIAKCPDCGEDVSLRGQVRIGLLVTCPNCEAELEVIDTDPVELDWVYEDDEDDEDEDW